MTSQRGSLQIWQAWHLVSVVDSFQFHCPLFCFSPDQRKKRRIPDDETKCSLLNKPVTPVTCYLLHLLHLYLLNLLHLLPVTPVTPATPVSPVTPFTCYASYLLCLLRLLRLLHLLHLVRYNLNFSPQISGYMLHFSGKMKAFKRLKKRTHRSMREAKIHSIL